MKEINAILLHDQEEPLAELKSHLELLSVKTTRARSCLELSQQLARLTTPCLVFTDTVLPDGGWADVLSLAAKASVATNVIVVARLVNIRFYVEVIERGAFDFITPPFDTSDLSHIVRCAAGNIAERQFAQARSA